MQAEKELAKARVEVAKEVRKAKEAEAAMDLHVSKAEERAHQELVKHAQEQSWLMTHLLLPLPITNILTILTTQGTAAHSISL